TAFPVFLTAGMTDFNYSELSQLDSQLNSLGIAHFLRRFGGVHEWAPAAVWPEALAWMNLQAMKDQRMPREEAFIMGEMRRFTANAEEVEKGGNAYLAAQAYRQVAAAFDGVASTEALQEHAGSLEKSAGYRSGEKRERDDLSMQSSLESEILRVTAGLR